MLLEKDAFPSNSRLSPFLKMASIPVEYELLYVYDVYNKLFQLFKWWCNHKIRQTYSSRNTLLEKGMCHSKIKIHHLEFLSGIHLFPW